MTKMTATKKKNPQDTTLRNVRASVARDNALRAEIVQLRSEIDKITALVASLGDRVTKLEQPV